METNRYQRGLDIIKEYTLTDNEEIGTHMDIVAAFKDLAPDLESYIVEFAFGDIYSREGLTNKQRTIATIASLVTLGTEPQLELHINTGITIGLTPKEIVGTIVHLIPYTGFPRVLNALKLVKKVFAQRNVKMND
ncbi:carboxymuconolactone decarboxylase family protein [Neobacillus sp. PS3-12]|jgi:4-carboxymuconolactone decarboxylase|uniref:carboxymuconolactone decarboxylase family protein n=1 Tax=Neobacillus sp. PS3-12 TaxID=3070677 RepID=UPI0027E11F99|nr:carboxymuconolactone decarboxylase family protein [Neobacillus sp. PS3-12]WML52442.1 carboxymuconolactone decarboxylase family protein [Neobacillus sp. PS3-12]